MINRSISHIEIPAKDRAKLSKFYENMFGWKIQSMDEKGVPYTVWQSGNNRGGFPDVGNMYKPGDIVIYIDSEDIEADLKNIEANGGKTLLKKTEIPNVGWYAFFADPTGNRMALYTLIKKS